MKEEFVNFDCEDPQKWTQAYLAAGMHPWTYFSGLLGCAKSVPVAEIMATVPRHSLDSFESYVLEMANIEKDEDLIGIGTEARVFGVSEIQQFARWFGQNRSASGI